VRPIEERDHQVPGRGFAEIERSSNRQAPTRTREIGAELTRQLSGSADLSALLWRLRHHGTTLLLISEEPWIPWELVRLARREGGEEEWGDFLCQAFAFTRWLETGLGPAELPLRRLAVVVPRDLGAAGGDAVATEEELCTLLALSGNAHAVVRVEAQRSAILEAMCSGGYDGWHFCGHGIHSTGDPNRDGILLDGGELLTPSALEATQRLGGARPLIFLNGCHTARGGDSLTQIGGWAKRFLDLGAGAFIGTRWAIDGGAACTFATGFYRSFLAGIPIGEAVRLAREQSREKGGSTWLAYTVYAHPAASVKGWTTA